MRAFAMSKPLWRKPEIDEVRRWRETFTAVGIRKTWLCGEEILAAFDKERCDLEKLRAQRFSLEATQLRHQCLVHRFHLRQLRDRRWLCFPQIVEEVRCQRRDRAPGEVFGELVASLRGGEFDVDGRPRVLLFSPDPFLPHRLTRELLEGVELADRTMPGASQLAEYLACAWIPCALTRSWLERRGYAWPPHFEREQLQPTDSTPTAFARVTPRARDSAVRHRRSGPPPAMRDRVRAAMEADIGAGRTTLEALAHEKKAVLEATYGTSRFTVSAALRELLSELSEFRSPTTPTNTDP
jgi:hypothetical protein